MNKKTLLVAICLLLLFSTVFAADFSQLEKAAARQKIRPELLQAIDSAKAPVDGYGLPGYQPKIEKIGKAIAQAIQIKNGKTTVLLDIENEGELEKISQMIEAKGGKVKGKFKIGKTIVAEVPVNEIESIAKNSEVEQIWPDFEVNAVEEPTQQINASYAWNLNLYGQGKKIAVLDTGIDSTHPALQGRVGAEENFSDSQSTTDVFGHGTHVAGIIAGSGEVQGVAPQAELLNGKVLNDSGSGSASSVIAGINWAIAQGANVINLSLGAPIEEDNTPLNQAVRDAVARGAVVVVASGNCGSNCPSSSCGGFTGVTMPGNTAEAVTVGTVDKSNNAACFSSGELRGGKIKPDVMAPGLGIVSSVPGGTEAKSGTSMSTPFVAGAAALVMEKHPELTALQVKQFLEETALDLGPAGEDTLFGWGLVDLSKIELDLNFSGDQNNWEPPDNNSGSDVNFSEAEFTFSGPNTVFKETTGSFSVWHQGLPGQGVSAQSHDYVDVIVEFVVFNEFGNVVERHFIGPKEYDPDSSASFDYDWIPQRTGNFRVQATVYREGVASTGMEPNSVEASTAEKDVKATVPADMLQINSLTVPTEIEQGTNASFSLNVTNNGYLDENAVAEVRFLDQTGNSFKIIVSQEEEIAIGQSEDLELDTLVEIPDGNYLVRGIVYFEDRNVSVEGSTEVFFPANCLLQNLSISPSVEINEELNGTVEFVNNTELSALPMLFGTILNGNQAVGYIVVDGNSVAPGETRQYGFSWKAEADANEYTFEVEVRYNGNKAVLDENFSVVDTNPPTIGDISFQQTVTQNQFNYISIKALDATGVFSATISISAPVGGTIESAMRFADGFDKNGVWGYAFAGVDALGTYSFVVQTCDEFGNCSSSASNEFQATAVPSECENKNILIVLGDEGFNSSGSGFGWISTVQGLDYCTQTWKKSRGGTPPIEFLEKFQVVVWSTGNRFGQSIDLNDEMVLVEFAQNGGKLLLEGAEIAFEQSNPDFSAEVMHSFLENDFALDGNNSSLVLSGHQLLEGIPAIDLNLELCPFPDSVTVTDSEAIANWNGGETAIVAYAGEESRILYYAFALDAIEDQDAATTLVANSIGWLLNTSPSGAILHLRDMPSYEKEREHYSGAATAEMILDYIRQSVGYPDLNQDWIYAYGHQRNSPENAGIAELDAEAMDAVLGHFDPYDSIVSNSFDIFDSEEGGNEYQGYNYSISTQDPDTNPEAINDYMISVAHWMAWPVPQEEWWLQGELVARPNTPAALPIYGDYNNWVAINGFAASGNPVPEPYTNPWLSAPVTMFGFWLTDPATDGIGKHVYVTAQEANETYFKPMNTGDDYNGKYLQIAEPPALPPAEILQNIEIESKAKAKIAKHVPDAGNLEFIGVTSKEETAEAESSMGAMDMENTAGAKAKKDSWRDLVDRHLLSDPEAIEAFDEAEMGEPILVQTQDTNAEYYLVPFHQVDKRWQRWIKRWPQLLRWLIRSRPTTTGVIMLDAEDGHFKQASWSKEPVKYLPITKKKAISLVRNAVWAESGKRLSARGAQAKLTWKPGAYSASPFKPFWTVKINNETWVVTQEGKTERIAAEAAQPEKPELQCPTQGIGKNYSFEWQAGGLERVYLQIGYDKEFSRRTYRQIYDKKSPTPIKRYYKTLTRYEKKATEGKLYARVYARDTELKKTYSEICEFTLK